MYLRYNAWDLILRTNFMTSKFDTPSDQPYQAMELFDTADWENWRTWLAEAVRYRFLLKNLVSREIKFATKTRF